MKKTVLAIFSLIIILVMIISVYLTIDVEANLKIRRKINTVLNPVEVIAITPQVIQFDELSYQIDPNSEWLLNEKKANQKTYMDIEHLKTEWISYNFDEKTESVSIVDGRHQIIINSTGKVSIDNVEIAERIELINHDNIWYLNLTDLNQIKEGAALGFIEQPYLAEGNLVVYNKYEDHNITTIKNERLVFSSQEGLERYLFNRFDINFLYKLKNIFSKTQVVAIEKNKTFFIFPTDSNSLFVVAEDNTIGYIAVEVDDQIESAIGEERTQVSLKKNAPQNIVMTWEAVYSYNPDTTQIGPMGNLNVISPTWYELKNEKGEVTSKASEDYVAWAKANQYQVWALASNAFDKDLTHLFLHDLNARMHFINMMISEAKKYGYDGINIDFENIYLEDKDALTHFIHELSIYMNSNELILSMDVTVMGGSDTWSKCYDHEKLGKIVDFLIIMSYDEHWASSPISGPVSSYDWVSYHLNQIAEIVSPSKLVMGIPLYTRVWRERPSSDIANQYYTKSSAIGMEAQNALLEKYELTPIWDETDKLFYATFFEEDAQVKLWIENAQTISAKLNIVKELNLRGAAMWRRGFETQDIWDVFDKINP